MKIDLMLHLDDDLHAELLQVANVRGWPVEEVVRERLLTGIGRAYQPPGPDAYMLMRPMVTMDLRT